MFRVRVEPVSLQAKKTARAAFDRQLANALNAYDFLINSQVTMSVRQWAPPRRRWETNNDPDLDNWLKPLIDSFVGADRLIVDDSLIRSIEVTWSEGVVTESILDIRLDFDAEHRLDKKSLRYIQFPGGLCYPLPGSLTGEAAKIWLTGADRALASVHELNAVSSDGWRLLVNGWIHRSRLASTFTVVNAIDLHAELQGGPA
jgi:Holliday junction resolvase RusA-like endonuclease